MPKVDPDSGQMMSDDPDQADPELAGGKTSGGFAKDHTDTGHHSPISASPGGDDEGTSAPSEVQGGNLGGNPGGGAE
ncbi:MAG: hypothetical protein M3O23_09115 [Actinomycetota bacterium]|nr:hypothetical protein [Actinomycetota bacterium]